jgi:hypothetical protein
VTTETTIEALLPWGEPKDVNTKFGPKRLRKAPIGTTSPFWGVWREQKAALRDAGISVSMNEKTKEWEVCWWQAPGAAATAAVEKAIVNSRSVSLDDDVEIPVPEGLAYMPFQRAGIILALRAMGDI